MALTNEQIWTAAEKISGSGIEPTCRLVREAVGGGSLATIQPALLSWRESRAIQSPLVHEPVPALVEQRIGQVTNELWGAARDAAEKRLAADREGFELARSRQDAALQEAAEFADVLTLEFEQAQLALAQSQAIEQALREEACEMRLQLSVAQARCAELDRHVAQLQQECGVAFEAEAQARERAAELGGRLQAVEALHEALVARLNPQQP